jgi:hypothetical protein
VLLLETGETAVEVRRARTTAPPGGMNGCLGSESE